MVHVKQRQGIQSIEVGFLLLEVLTRSKRPMKLCDLARVAGMATSKAHRYLVSFVRMGFVEQNSETGLYDLGGAALRLGIAKLARLDVVRLSRPIMESLCTEIGETVALAVWTDRGPICVRCVDSGSPVKLILRTGAVLPLLSSAAGLVFAAFHRASVLNKLLYAELSEKAKACRTPLTALASNLNTHLAEICIQGVARMDGGVTIGINGISAPIFDHTGSLVAALMLGGTEEGVDLGSIQVFRVKEAAKYFSMLLGYQQEVS